MTTTQKTNDKFELNVEARQASKANNSLGRKNLKVPGVVYGPKIKNALLFTPERKISRYLSHQFDNTIFTLKSEDSSLNNVQVLLKHKDIHPVTRRLTHVDFYALDLTKTVRVHVELRFTGKAKGLADGGLLQATARDVEVECLPNKIPEFFEVDVSDLGVHDSVHASDLKLPADVKLMTDPGVTLVTVTIIKEEVAAPVVAAGAAPLAEPEVIAKGKKDKEGEEGAAPAAGGAAPAGDAKKGEAKK